MSADTPSRLRAEPGSPPRRDPADTGSRWAGEAQVLVPDGIAGLPAVPLVVLLHGAGSSGGAMLDLLGDTVREAGALVLAPDSRGPTWDVIMGGFGPDVRAIDAALTEVYARWPVDPARTVIAGFSDGASYALSLGLANGDRFSHVVAFSPGFVAADAARGRPPILISHGRSDPVLPIDRCSRRLVPALRAAGHEVRYLEFDGGHGVPPDVARAALEWVRATPPTAAR